MKKLMIASVVCNLTLITLLLLAHNRRESELNKHKSELHSNTQQMMRADEAYIHLLGQTLDAMESPEAKESKAIVDAVRKLLATGKENKELRKSLGL
ncbi:MAG: hypothetical protein GY930_19690 [bacterium]|nr:hypothetical protein [bacterium]